jgi:hypothetical protein
VHESVDVPLPPVIVVGFNVHDELVEFDVTARITVAANPFRGATVIVEVIAEPATPVTEVGLGFRVKS